MIEAKRHALAAAAVIAAVVSVVVVGRVRHALSARASEEQCRELLDRYLEQAERQKNPTARDEEIARALEGARRAASHGADVRACTEDLSAEQVSCGLRSPNVDEIERCLQ